MDAPFLFLVFAIVYSYFLSLTFEIWCCHLMRNIAAGHHFSKYRCRVPV